MSYFLFLPHILYFKHFSRGIWTLIFEIKLLFTKKEKFDVSKQFVSIRKWNISKRRSYLSPSHRASWCGDPLSTSVWQVFWSLTLCLLRPFFLVSRKLSLFRHPPRCTLGEGGPTPSARTEADNLSQWNMRRICWRILWKMLLSSKKETPDREISLSASGCLCVRNSSLKLRQLLFNHWEGS